ncbi:carboxypeptidase-like regulatory domain-containing protein [Patulibacter americanus]|uniref:carboxypeptidase-like regulatory domain-containing protein n=1 Tax=Patulibacter americanus TaxID=588672 RepID=UPI0003B4B25B|nr:carboxypeptidase-like regulatory domain-containing protein [Patulibacter americanus]
MSPLARPRPARPAATPAALLLAVLATLVALSLTAPRASAATYEVWSCRGPQAAPTPSGAWVPATAPETAPKAVTADTCADGGALRAALIPNESHAKGAASLTFGAPAGTRIVGFDVDHTVATGTMGFFSPGSYVSELVATDPGPGQPATALTACSAPRLGSGCSTAAVARRDATAPSLGGLVLRATCPSNGCGSANGVGAEAVLRSARVALDDPAAPVVESVGGTLAGSSTGGTRTVTVAARDTGGGVAGITASVDGARPIVDAAGGTCAVPYSAAQPCPAAREALFGVITSTLSPGTHSIAGTVADAAGNLTPWGPVAFTVPTKASNGAKSTAPGAVPVPGGSPVAVDGRLTVTSTRTKSGLLRPSGRLTTAKGTPIARAKVRLTRTRIGAKRPVTTELKTVRTDQDGRFTAATLPEGAWNVGAAAVVRDGTATAARLLKTPLRVTADASPRRLRTGGRAVLAGRLTGAGLSRKGAPVRIQVIAGGRWRTVAAVRTDAVGRWRWRHRFTKVSRPTLFSFRAVVPQVGTWPWADVAGRAPTVRVDP